MVSFRLQDADADAVQFRYDIRTALITILVSLATSIIVLLFLGARL